MTILIVGCGNMGGAMLSGWLAAGLPASDFTIVDPVLAEAPAGVRLLRDATAAKGPFDVLLLGIKPQLLRDVAPRLSRLAGQRTLLLSILAGVELETLAGHFPQAGGLVRIMPNLAAAIGKSPVGLAAKGLSDAQRASVDALMRALGTPEWLESESMFDAITALAGSGPAFVYRFISALAQAGAETGLPADQSERLALAMVEGAALLAASSPHSPDELARRVASPGGTTQAGLDVLDAGNALSQLVEATVRAARDRSAEMARAARADQG